jgi:hypothetical protein
MKRKRTEFEELLIRDAWASRRYKMTLSDPIFKVWHHGVQNGDLYALILFRKHKKQGRL